MRAWVMGKEGWEMGQTVTAKLLHQEASGLRRDGGFPTSWKEWSAS